MNQFDCTFDSFRGIFHKKCSSIAQAQYNHNIFYQNKSFDDL